MKSPSSGEQSSSAALSYIPDDRRVPEFTVQAVLLGFILSIIFNAANAYLGLKIGLTVSASIPSAIISMGVLRMLLPRLIGRNGTILENNIVHTIASNGESLAAAVIFTVPALLFLGGELSNAKVFWLGVAGGLLGLLMMIPLRHSLVVLEHETLPFPEGRAAAEVLVAGDKGGATAAPVLQGALVGGLFKFAMSALMLFKDAIVWTWPNLHKAGFGYEVSPLFVGVGYLIGARIVAVMFAGSLLGYLVLIPLIDALGGSNVIEPGTMPIDQMSMGQIRSTYVRYIGAGGVAFGGLLSLLRSLPLILGSLNRLWTVSGSEPSRRASGNALPAVDWENGAIVFGGAALGFLVGAFAGEIDWSWMGLARMALGGAVGAAVGAVLFFYLSRTASRFGAGLPRTEHDLPIPVVGLGVASVGLLLWLHPIFGLSAVEAAIVLLFAFFFVAVSARMVGLIGTTNQPVSGMTITALLSMTLLFAALGHDPATLKTAAIMGGAVVCVAIALSGDLSQDLKTAALVGATPWKVQLAEIMGTLVSAVRTGFILLLLYMAYGFGAPTPEHPNPLEAPQASLMASLVQGATGGQLPWTLLLTGAGIGLIVEMCGISALAFAIGLYLPITNWPMMMVGGLLAWYVARKKRQAVAEHDPGSLYASGLIAGDALMGIVIAGIAVISTLPWAGGLSQFLQLRRPEAGHPAFETLLSTGLYAAVVYSLYRHALGKKHSRP
ncbi:MAG: oligopeptide transporter, OPT family [Elusimicrobia bacterium]|nr:oligopeptide transporter, OPT family [Elusimicrobiota bacterium]